MTSATMQAVRLTAWGTEPVVVTVPVPTPEPGQLLLQVDAAGLCHSDLHVIEGGLPYELPFTLGHEVAGTVVELGDGVADEWLGQQVAVHGVWSCGTCRRCQDGRENYCLNLTGPIGCGLGYDGGLAEFMLVPSERYLVPASRIDPAGLAPLTDAGLTAYHAVSANLDALGKGGTALVIGVGGVGHLAVQVLRALSDATVIAADPRSTARALAHQHGAALVVDDVAALCQGQGEAGVDLVLDCVGSDATLTAAADLLLPGGRLVVVGSAGGGLVAGKSVGLPRGWQLAAPFWGSRSDVEAVVDLATRGRLASATETGTLSDVPALYRRLRDGGVTGRAVIVNT